MLLAVKATGPGPIVGTALEGLASGQGLIVAFVQRSYLGATLAPTARVGAPSDSEHADAQTPGLVENPADATTVSRLTAPLTMTASDNLASSRDILHVDAEGNIFTRGAFHPAAMDLAEFFSVSESAEAGDVLAIDPQNPGQFRRARQAHDTSVVGIVSETPGVLLGSGIDRIVAADATLAAGLEQARLLGDDLREEELWQELKTRFRETHAPVALSGTVPCKVDAGFGAIRPGDLLTTSPTPGHAMRAGDAVAGTIIGKALEPLEDGTGTIRVLVMMR